MAMMLVNGKIYAILGNPHPSSDSLPPPYVKYREAKEGEKYHMEFWADAVGDDGRYKIRWVVPLTKGKEMEEEINWNLCVCNIERMEPDQP